MFAQGANVPKAGPGCRPVLYRYYHIRCVSISNGDTPYAYGMSICTNNNDYKREYRDNNEFNELLSGGRSVLLTLQFQRQTVGHRVLLSFNVIPH